MVRIHRTRPGGTRDRHTAVSGVAVPAQEATRTGRMPEEITLRAREQEQLRSQRHGSETVAGDRKNYGADMESDREHKKTGVTWQDSGEATKEGQHVMVGHLIMTE